MMAICSGIPYAEDLVEISFQDTINELCVADFVETYCSACSTGQGCCVDPTCSSCSSSSSSSSSSSEIGYIERKYNLMEQYNYEYNSGHITREEMREYINERYNEDVEDLSDSEIIKRLLTQNENYSSDQPLEVILEMVGEEDEDNNENEHNVKNLVNDEKLSGDDENVLHREERVKANAMYGLTPKMEDEVRRRSGEMSGSEFEFEKKHSDNLPSFGRANTLINEIESCFMETAMLVEKTLGSSSKNSTLKRNSNSNSSTLKSKRDSSNEGLDRKEMECILTKNVEKALGIFDSIIHVKKRKDELSSTSNDEEYKSPGYRIPSNIEINKNNIRESSRKPFYDEHSPTFDEAEYPNLKLIHNDVTNILRHSVFEEEVEELFRQCYDLTSIEPSTSLNSCLTNLENLCLQLQKARDNLLGNKDESSIYSSNDESIIINELIENKIKKRISRGRSMIEPPLIGLEGNTHKNLAEVSPKPTENDLLLENVMSLQNFKGNYEILQDGIAALANHTETQHSSKTNSLDCENYEGFSPTKSSCIGNNNDHMLYRCDNTQPSAFYNENTQNRGSLDEEIPGISHEETVSLYEDNQELQQSLLSILHNLNDIHNNLLTRRRNTNNLSQRKSGDSCIFHDYENLPILSLTPEPYEPNRGSFLDLGLSSVLDESHGASNLEERPNMYAEISHFDQALQIDQPLPLDNSNVAETIKGEDDFKSIAKIMETCEELRNLWLYHDQNTKTTSLKPSRAVSFNHKYVKSYEKPKLSTVSNPEPYRLAPDLRSVRRRKYYSMPNLNNERILSQEEADLTSALITDFKNFSKNRNSLFSSILRDQKRFSTARVMDFIKQMKKENAKCYEITLNFLKRIMEACKVLEGESDDSYPSTDSTQPTVINGNLTVVNGTLTHSETDTGYSEDRGNSSDCQSCGSDSVCSSSEQKSSYSEWKSRRDKFGNDDRGYFEWLSEGRRLLQGFESDLHNDNAKSY